MTLNNRIRILSDLVGLEAWHAAFTPKRLEVSLHADVTFLTALMGGEAESPARFGVNLKRAELRIWLPDGEGVNVVRSSVARMTPDFNGTQKRSVERKSAAGAGASLGMNADKASLSATGAMSISANRDVSVREEATAAREFKAVISTHSPDGNGGHRWMMTPGDGRVLVGKPWAAAEMPLMSLRDRRSKQTISPAVHLEITCLREDLHISDFELKDGSLWKRVRNRMGSENRIRAAEAFIRNRIEERGLGAPEMGERFTVIRLAQVSAVEEW